MLSGLLRGGCHGLLSLLSSLSSLLRLAGAASCERRRGLAFSQASTVACGISLVSYVLVVHYHQRQHKSIFVAAQQKDEPGARSTKHAKL